MTDSVRDAIVLWDPRGGIQKLPQRSMFQDQRAGYWV